MTSTRCRFCRSNRPASEHEHESPQEQHEKAPAAAQDGPLHEQHEQASRRSKIRAAATAALKSHHHRSKHGKP